MTKINGNLALGNIPDSFYEHGDATNATTLKAAIARMNNLEDAVIAAFNGLVVEDADYTEVDQAITKIPADLSIYTDETVAAVNMAKESVDRTKKATEQAEVAEMVKAIENAVSALVKRGADYTAVDTALAKIPADLGVYTEATAGAVTAAENAVVRGKDITEQTAVDGYVTAIEDAVAALVYKGADYSAVDAAIVTIPSDLSIYTDATASAVTAAENAVVRNKDITEQTIVNGYATAIENAVKALVKKAPEVPGTDEKQDYVVDSVTGIKVEYEDGSEFDSTVTLRLTPKSKYERDQLKNAVDKAAKGLTLAGLYDIKMMKDGVAIQLDGKVKVSIPLTDKMKAMSDLKIIYIDDNGNATVIPSQIIDGKIIFTTDHFSYYGVIGKVKTDSNPSKIPQTGDSSNIVLWFMLGIGALTIIIMQAIVVKKRRFR